MSRVNNIINTSHPFSPVVENMPVIHYSGTINPQSIPILLARIEDSLSSVNSPAGRKKKIVGIAIELLQNVYHHCPLIPFENKGSTHSFIFEKTEERFMLTTSNAIYQTKITSLEKQITNLNSYTPEELKNQYLAILKNEPLQGEHAGLGLIDILRKSGKPILYKFTPKGNNYSLFTVSVLV